ncbi:MAG: monovalent cation/H+ antiporter subunit D family protein [Motiliproteus sp.]
MNTLEQLPVLAVVLPLLAAPLCVLVGRERAAWFIAVAAAVTSAVAAALLLRQVSVAGSLSYALGGWAPPWGIEYRVDLLGGYVLLLVTVIAALVIWFARHSIEREIAAERRVAFYAALLLVQAGLAGITVTGDAFNLFVFLEIASLASYALVSMGSDRRALSAAFNYLVLGTLGATFILIGIGFLYMMTGTLNMQDLAARLPAVADSRTVRAGFAFLSVGIGLKLALFPLHFWLPNAYTYAPSVVSALLAATATKVALYIMLRLIFGVFGMAFVFEQLPTGPLLITLGVVGVLSGSLVALFQDNVKRLLAYSSIAQVGYMALAMGLASATGVTAAMLHLFNHALMKGALFLALAAVAYRLGATGISQFAGLGRRMPWTLAAMVIAGLSLIGVPATAGFISKWFLIQACLEQGLWPLALVILVGSLLALVYVWRIIEAAYFAPWDERRGDVQEAPLSMLLPLWLLVGANLYFGIDTDLTLGVALRATAVLLGGGV